jgi:hypothetical protein
MKAWLTVARIGVYDRTREIALGIEASGRPGVFVFISKGG